MAEELIKTPWTLEDGSINFPYRALHDKVFMWRIPPVPKFIKSVIEIPKQYLEYYQDGSGIILSVGPGYWSQKGEWIASNEKVKPGTRVMIHKGVPWETRVTGLDGKRYSVTICHVVDIFGVL